MISRNELVFHLNYFINPLPPKANGSFPKSTNKDTLPVYNTPFESHRSAYLRNDISSYDGGRHFERNCFKIKKISDLKNV